MNCERDVMSFTVPAQRKKCPAGLFLDTRERGGRPRKVVPTQRSLLGTDGAEETLGAVSSGPSPKAEV